MKSGALLRFFKRKEVLQLVFRPAIGFFKIVSLPLFRSWCEGVLCPIRLSVLTVYLL